jgi:hypothetical protein
MRIIQLYGGIHMFWIGTLFGMIIMAIAMIGVVDLIEREEMEDEYETEYYIIYK